LQHVKKIHITVDPDFHDAGIVEEGQIVSENKRFNIIFTSSEQHGFQMVGNPLLISGLIKVN